MELRLSNWSERQTYFLGRYYDLPAQLVLRLYLKPGDRFVDVGANIGMITLLAARLVAPAGTVDAVEPNPECCDRLDRCLELNAIRHVRVHRVGFADSAMQLTLSVLTSHSGLGTLARVPEPDQHLVSARFTVPVVCGDEVIETDAAPVTAIKIDAEGFECRVLRGMARTLARWHPLVITEVVPAWLQRAGSTPLELFDLMHGHRYRGYALSTHRNFVRHRLRLASVADPTGLPANDVLWIHARDPRHSILSPFMA
ncbi:MAG: FkbM family methyltransferase [Deltaproteobacteria bacterium]|nr:FkbM family methyltransferase [Deltaproteobacteria bacterium]MBI3386199.1 FkbM family methyltransferase [Deltaproteobacteria bacterium]